MCSNGKWSGESFRLWTKAEEQRRAVLWAPCGRVAQAPARSSAASTAPGSQAQSHPPPCARPAVCCSRGRAARGCSWCPVLVRAGTQPGLCWLIHSSLQNARELLRRRTCEVSLSGLRSPQSRREVFEITVHSCLYCYFIP